MLQGIQWSNLLESCEIYQQQLSAHVPLPATWRQTSNSILTRYRDIATKRHKHHMPRQGMSRVKSTRARFRAGAARKFQGPVIGVFDLKPRFPSHHTPPFATGVHSPFRSFSNLFEWIGSLKMRYHFILRTSYVCLCSHPHTPVT